MIRSGILAISVALLSCGMAHAADLEPPASFAPAGDLRPSFSWGGAYAGVSVGYKANKGTGTWRSVSEDVSASAATVNGFAGYNYEISPSVIAGLEAELGYDWSKATTAIYGTRLRGGFDTAVRARLGYAYDRALFYLAAGYAGTTLKMDLGNFSAKQWLNGWTIGVGADYAITDKMFLRGEYRYTRYARKDVQFANVNNRIDLSSQALMLGLGMKF
jgi:outer membrane immunogenic protein